MGEHGMLCLVEFRNRKDTCFVAMWQLDGRVGQGKNQLNKSHFPISSLRNDKDTKSLGGSLKFTKIIQKLMENNTKG